MGEEREPNSASSAHIVVVDDDAEMRTILRSCFEAENYQVSVARSGAQLDRIMATEPVDLVTLDIGLGSEDGLAIARRLRDHSDVGIVMVTGREDVIDKVLGLEFGADDYITKPFNLREVVARIKSVLRRRLVNPVAGASATGKVGFTGWVLDGDNRELTTPDGVPCPLTSGEFELLLMMVRKPNRVLTREQILAHTRGADWVANDRVVDNQINRLRRKMMQAARRPAPISSIRGAGYMLNAKVEVLHGAGSAAAGQETATRPDA